MNGPYHGLSLHCRGASISASMSKNQRSDENVLDMLRVDLRTVRDLLFSRQGVFFRDDVLGAAQLYNTTRIECSGHCYNVDNVPQYSHPVVHAILATLSTASQAVSEVNLVNFATLNVPKATRMSMPLTDLDLNSTYVSQRY